MECCSTSGCNVTAWPDHSLRYGLQLQQSEGVPRKCHTRLFRRGLAMIARLARWRMSTFTTVARILFNRMGTGLKLWQGRNGTPFRPCVRRREVIATPQGRVVYHTALPRLSLMLNDPGTWLETAEESGRSSTEYLLISQNFRIQ